jgi:acetyl esterase/lipase
MMRRGFAIAALAGLALWLSACSPLRALNAVVPSDGYAAHREIAYGPDERQALDVYTPVDAAGPAPVVVFFYGGSWKYGSRWQYEFVAEALTERGYVAVVPDYRVYPEATFPAFVADGAGALRWVRDHIAGYGGDPGRIYLMGHSAGAYITALLSLDPRYLAAEGLPRGTIRGMVGISGPYAFNPLEYDSVRAIFADYPEPEDLRPINFADGSAPPMLLLHGGDDGTVYPANSRALADRVEAAGGEAEYVEIPDTGHIAIVLALAKPFRRDGGVFDTALAFLDRREYQLTAGRPFTPDP